MKAKESTSQNPYLSLVSVSRNDEHGGNMLGRMQVSLNSLFEQLEKYRIESELILVEWNPPADKPLLKDVINWTARLQYCTIRTVVVPPSIHRNYRHADKIPLNTTVAINCGIRRARGQFILYRSIDAIYSDELMSYIATRSLKEDGMYRVDRCDVDRKVVQYQTLNEQLDYARQNIIRVNSHLHDGIKYGLPDLHTNACGDFQLMSRRYWHLLRGYREADIIAAYVDGLLSYASYAAGMKEVILADPMRIYHIDHGNKFTDRINRTEPSLEKWLPVLFLPAWFTNRIIARYRKSVLYRFKSSVHGVGTLDYTDYLAMCHDIVAGKRSYIFNNKNWGLVNKPLAEYLVVRADWDKGYGKN